jgi:hypothetical protein
VYAPGWGTIIPPMVSVFNKQIGWMAEDLAGSAPSSASFAGDVHYYPIVLCAGCVVRRVWWANGATTTGGATVEVGVYANSSYGPGAKLISGSATQGTASQVQFADVTDTSLAPGLYWLALVASTTTNTTFFLSSVVSANFEGALKFQQTGTTLPTAATPVESSSTHAYLFGFATTASP